MKGHRIIFDGRHLLWRCCDSFQDLEAEVEGQMVPTGGIYGFLLMMIRVYTKWGGKDVAVCWEGERNWRFDRYPEYKRKKKEKTQDEKDAISEMILQEARLGILLGTAGIQQYRVQGYEADDTIAALAKKWERQQLGTVAIYSGDSDLRQLVKDGSCVAIAPTTQGKSRGTEVRYDEAAVFERHGVYPNRIPDLKALSGDSSDNIPGVPGVGQKKALKLLNHYGSVAKVLRAALSRAEDWPETPRVLKLVRAHAKDVILYLDLTRLRRDVPIELVTGWTGDQKSLVGQLKAYKLRTLVQALELATLMKMAKTRYEFSR